MGTESKGLVLVVDDEPALVALLRDRLARAGYGSLAAYSAEEAETLLRGSSPDLILLDHSLPGKSGLEFIAGLHGPAGEKNAAEAPPFIVTTGRGDERLAVEMMKLGAADYLVKDGEFLSRVVPALGRALENSRLRLELRRTEEMFRYVFENSSQPKSLTAMDGTLRPNPALCALLGYSRAELERKSWREITPAEDIPETERIIADLLSGSSDSARFEKRYLRSDGGVVWGDVSVSLKRDADGRPEFFITAINDITGKKLMEELLRQQEHRFRELYENMRDCVAVYQPSPDGDFVISEVNKALEKSEGVRREEVVGRRVTDVFPGIGEMGLLEVLRKVSETGLPAALGPRKYADSRRQGWRDNYVYRLPGGEVVALYTDVTAEMAALEKSRESEARDRALLESIPDIVMNFDAAHRHTFVSSNLREYGLEPAQLAGKTHRELGFPSGLCAQLEAALDKVFATGLPHNVEYEADLPAGRRIFDWRLAPLKRGDAVLSVTTAARDITQYRALETDYRMLFDSMLDGFAIHELIFGPDGKPADYRFLRINKSFEAITGIKAASAEGRLVSEALGGRHQEWVDLYAGVVRSGAPLRITRYEPTLKKHFDIVAFRNKPGQFTTIFRDITAQVRADAERELLSETIKASLNEVYIFDEKTLRFKFANYGAIKNIGYTEKELYALTPLDLKPEMNREEFLGIAEDLRAGRKELAQFTTRHRRKDGSLYPVEVRLQYEVDNKVFLAVVADISERLRTESALREQAVLLEQAGKMARFGGWSVDLGSDRVNWSDQVAAIHEMPAGHSPRIEEGINFYAPEWRPRIAGVFKACVENGTPYDEELELITAKGNRKWVRATGQAARNAAGKIVKVFGSFQDINDRKLSELALRESARELQEAQRRARLGTYRFDMATGAFSVSETVYEIYGVDKGYPHSSEGWRALIHPEDRERVTGLMADLLAGKIKSYSSEHRMVSPKDGRTVWVDSRGQAENGPDGRPARVVGSMMDITERKLAELALRESEERYRAVAEYSNNAICIIDERGQFAWINGRMTEMGGYTEEDLIGASFADMLAPESKEFVLLNFLKFTRGEPYERHYTFSFIRADGKKRTCEKYMTDFQTHDGKRNLVVSMMDITERLAAEEEKDRLAAAIEQAGEAVIITDSGGIMQYVNPAFERVTGYQRGEAVGRNPRMLNSGRQDAAFYRRMWGELLAGRQWSGQMVNRRKDGTLFTEEALISPVKDADGRVTNYIAVKRDVTERLALEESLRQSQKMESVGLLAGGIAHDFNNLLTGITGYAAMLKKSLPEDDQRRADAQEILDTAERAAELTRQLLIFSRREVARPVDIDICGAVRSAQRLLGRVLGENVRMEVSLPAEPCMTEIDPGHFTQVLMNLAVNARDAMPSGGTLRISASCGARMPGSGREAVLLEVEDNGCGMSPEVLSHIFEPFFTTKERGKGTGLGLSTVYGIVTQAGGQINVRTMPGDGTTFSVYLPGAAPKPQASTGPEEGWEGQLAGGRGETILIVEDEERLRVLARRMLEAAGYRVLEADCGKEALEKAAGLGRPVDAVVSDLVLPGMNGRELAAELCKRGLASRFLYVSGYTDELVSSAGVLKDGLAFLSKPFTPQLLAEKLRRVLDGPPEECRP